VARSLRVEYPGAYYHVMARGNRREDIFLDEDDREFFLKAVSEACAQTGWLVHAWVLMSNHYHLRIETPEANLVDGMKWLQNTYMRRFNVRHRAWGRVFGDRYKAVVVAGLRRASGRSGSPRMWEWRDSGMRIRPRAGGRWWRTGQERCSGSSNGKLMTSNECVRLCTLTPSSEFAEFCAEFLRDPIDVSASPSRFGLLWKTAAQKKCEIAHPLRLFLKPIE
jgi:REP element-mobilizing transposase RayT